MLAWLLTSLLLKLTLCASDITLTEQVSTEFIKNLNARDLGYDFPVNYADIECPQHVVEDKSKVSIAILPFDALSRVIEFLAYEDSKSLLESSRACNHIAKQWIRKRLSSFSPHFLFNHEGLNHLLAFELSRYFEAQTNISDVDACDQYELACFDGLIRSKPAISPKLGYLIQAFIHESLYGSDSPIPSTLSQWKMFTVMKIINDKTRNYNKSLNCLIQVNRNIINEEFDDPLDRMKLNEYLDLFIDFILSPSLNIESLIHYEERKQLLGLESRHLQVSFDKEIKLIMQIYFHEHIVPQEQTLSVLKNVIKSGLYSKSLFDRAVDTIDTCYREFFLKPEFFTNRMVFKHYIDKFVELDISYDHMITRNPFYPLCRTRINKCASMLYAMASIASPSLIVVDSILKIGRWTENKIEHLILRTLSVPYSAYAFGHDIVFDILLNDFGGRRVNFFYRENDNFRLVNCFNSGPNGLQEAKMRNYLKYLLRDADPLPHIFIKPELLFEFADLITDKFILSKRYSIDIYASDIDGSPHLNILASKKGQILSFMEIIEVLQFPGLQGLFSSKPIPKSNTPYNGVVSIANFVNIGSVNN